MERITDRKKFGTKLQNCNWNYGHVSSGTCVDKGCRPAPCVCIEGHGLHADGHGSQLQYLPLGVLLCLFWVSITLACYCINVRSKLRKRMNNIKGYLLTTKVIN